jgi:hypothetical protein
MQSEQTTTYKNYTIVYSAKYDTIGFMGTAMITWTTRQGSTMTIFRKSPKTYPAREPATSAALEEAKSWIDSQPPV